MKAVTLKVEIFTNEGGSIISMDDIAETICEDMIPMEKPE